MSRAAQATAAEIQLEIATTEADAMAHVMTINRKLFGDIISSDGRGALGMAVGSAAGFPPAAIRGAGSLSRGGSVATLAGKLLAGSAAGWRLLRPPQGRPLLARPRGPLRAPRCDQGRSGPQRPHMNEGCIRANARRRTRDRAVCVVRRPSCVVRLRGRWQAL